MRSCVPCPDNAPECSGCPKGTECALTVQTCEECAKIYCRPIKSSSKLSPTDFGTEYVSRRPASSIPYRIVIGCIVGGVLALALVAILIFCLLSRSSPKSSQRSSGKTEPEDFEETNDPRTLELEHVNRIDPQQSAKNLASAPIYYHPRPVPSAPRKAPQVPPSFNLARNSAKNSVAPTSNSPPPKPRTPSQEVRSSLNTLRSRLAVNGQTVNQTGRTKSEIAESTSPYEHRRFSTEPIAIHNVASTNEDTSESRGSDSSNHRALAGSESTDESQTVLNIYESYAERPSSSMYID